MAYNKYHEGKIYRLLSPSRPDIDPYYGSTTETLGRRFSKHKYNAKYRCDNMSKNIIDTGDVIIELVEDFSCENRNELECRERWWIEHNPCSNKNIPTRTIKERYKDNREENIKRSRTYYIQNKEEVNKRQGMYQKTDKCREKRKQPYTCTCGSTFSRSNKAQHERTQRHINYISTIDI
jgi:hypothetical protein